MSCEENDEQEVLKTTVYPYFFPKTDDNTGLIYLYLPGLL